MDTAPSLLEQIAHPETLLAAWRRVAANRAAGGSDGVSVAAFAESLEANLRQLQEELLEERYVPRALRQVRIPKELKPGEQRTLHLPSVRDKVVQEATRTVLEPRFERLFLDCNYGYRKGKGAHRAIARVRHYLRFEKRRWAVTADIDDFFGSLNHTLLLERLAKFLHEEAVVRLLGLWLKIGAVDGGGRWHDVYSGVSQGGVISPLLANFYLHPFDDDLTRQGFGLVRYADDFVILCRDRPEAGDAFSRAVAFLEQELSLRLNPNPEPIHSIEAGFGFLGMYFHGDRLEIESAKEQAIIAKIARLVSRKPDATVVSDLNEAIRGWRRYYGTLLAKESLTGLEEHLERGLTHLVAQGFRADCWKSSAAAVQALGEIETLMPLEAQERRRVLERVVKEGRAEASTPWRKNGHLQAASPRPKRSAAATNQRKPGRTQALYGVRKGERLETALGRVKRHHYRQAAHLGEVVLDTPGSFLGVSRGRLVVRRERRIIYETPLHHVHGITITGEGMSFSSDAIHRCMERGIPVVFLSRIGRVVALLSAPVSWRTQIGLKQLEAVARGGPALDLAKQFVAGKIHNQMNLFLP